MSMFCVRSHAFTVRGVFLLAGVILTLRVAPVLAETPGAAAGSAPAASATVTSDPVLEGVGAGAGQVAPVAPCHAAALGSPYIPMDSWVYPELSRLFSLGYLDLSFQ